MGWAQGSRQCWSESLKPQIPETRNSHLILDDAILDKIQSLEMLYSEQLKERIFKTAKFMSTNKKFQNSRVTVLD